MVVAQTSDGHPPGGRMKTSYHQEGSCEGCVAIATNQEDTLSGRLIAATTVADALIIDGLHQHLGHSSHSDDIKSRYVVHSAADSGIRKA